MKKFMLLTSLLVFTSSLAVKSIAGELDDEKSISNQELQGTVIVRIDTRDNSVAYVKSDAKIATENEAQIVAKTGEYITLSSNQIKSELDKDAGSSSWYFYNNNNCGYYCNGSSGYNSGYNYGYNYNYSMYWYGNYYNPMYNYNYGNYQYYYYCQNRWW